MHYFGTDGIRLQANALLDKQIPYTLGRLLSKHRAKIIVARDVRTSSMDIEKQLCKGLLAGSAQIWLAGVLPTPALAYTAQTQKADYAIMITASHNPPEFNGLKVFGKHGRKLSCEQEEKLDGELYNLLGNISQIEEKCDMVCADTLTEEEELSELKIRISEQNHRIRIVEGAEFLYAKHIKKMFPRLDGIKVCVDCANGCFATLAPHIFEELGASVRAINNVRDGNAVNVNCGCTHMQTLAKHVQSDEIGFAFDGDGDRVLAIVNNQLYDGDAMLLALSTLYRLQGKLKKRFIVGTIYTSTRLQRELIYQNVALLRTDVGDKNILDALHQNGYLLGGEKSGHIIILDRANTGDGLVTALSLLEAKRTLGALPKFTPYPILEINLPKPDTTQAEQALQAKIDLIKAQYARQGKLILRPSGTEPYLRFSFECFTQNHHTIFSDIQKILGAVESRKSSK